ncbi:uncharacterized protein TRIADDRAFT_52878 [Trichoplax adhaerens]|uniref:Uncharacterized protein n=1 Tax=Trichoplax adhaerens TaxID=10228 RepID=B3RMP7_TRIAD|nr:predicted protein [Trichoplax adhaerens]EDV27311.1 predicted protein [Trichoplax adhaerens]|eukprot:XP_002109145.1 predicted protein [Trichoplax adhaerens]
MTAVRRYARKQYSPRRRTWKSGNKFKRRNYRRKRVGTATAKFNGPVGTVRGPFPARERVQLTYAFVRQFDPRLNQNVAFACVSLTNIFDPDPAIGGSQPVFRDEMFQLCDHAVVIAAKVEMWISPSGSNNNSLDYMLCLLPRDKTLY